MKWLMIPIVIFILTGCSLIPELDNLGPDLGIRVASPQEAINYGIDHVIAQESDHHHTLPSRTLKQGFGDCLDHSLLALKILHDSGITGQLVYTAKHAWIRIDGQDYETLNLNGRKLVYEDYSGTQYILQYSEIIGSAWLLYIDLNP